jgi:hypothetical protein
LGYDNPCTAGKSHKETDEGIDDGTDGSYGGEGLVADIVANDPSVNRIIQLLENITQ